MKDTPTRTDKVSDWLLNITLSTEEDVEVIIRAKDRIDLEHQLNDILHDGLYLEGDTVYSPYAIVSMSIVEQIEDTKTPTNSKLSIIRCEDNDNEPRSAG